MQSSSLAWMHWLATLKSISTNHYRRTMND